MLDLQYNVLQLKSFTMTASKILFTVDKHLNPCLFLSIMFLQKTSGLPMLATLNSPELEGGHVEQVHLSESMSIF